MEETNIIPTLLNHSDKALSGALLVYFLVKLQPAITKLSEIVRDLKEISERRERQADNTEKKVIELMAQLKYQKVGENAFKKD